MHPHPVQVVVAPLPRPAKVVQLEARRQARAEQEARLWPPQRPAA
ncbi:MAG TPA: hypothetical protein VHC67_05210 [Gaiellaceae bacterium]|jgi:hypothetical protein|nr:hypothetical protein [Gaiellaceae bacterium]